MTTVQQVFDTAIMLMDEQSESTGKTVTTDTSEYRYRTLSILNVLLPQLYPYSDTYDNTHPGRPLCPPLQLPQNATQPDFTQPVPLDDGLCWAVLPYGLAAHLLASENESLSAWFRNRYEVSLVELRNKIPASFKPIYNPYGFF